MGRLLKKKDPGKKRTLREIKVEPESGVTPAAGAAVIKKPAILQKQPASVPKPKASLQEPNFIQKSSQFLREVKIELKKVTWPSRKQTLGSTIVVLILVFIISLFLGLVDFGLSSLIRTVLP